MSKGKTQLSSLLEELSEREKELDDLIASANLELQRIDFETWLKEPVWYEPFPQETPDGVKSWRAVFFGFACVNGRWQLAAREGTHKCKRSTEKDEAKWATDLAPARPLASEPRYIRVSAMFLLTELFEEIESKVLGLVGGLDCGKEAIEDL